MVYVISDLHGYPVERFKELLAKAEFCDSDYLFVLGDVIDRNGDGGVGILQYISKCGNIELLMGNHEAMLLSCRFIFDEVTDESIEAFNAEKYELLAQYLSNGGEATIAALKRLCDESPEDVEDLLEYLEELPLYDIVTVAGKDYLLVHSGIENFEKSKGLSQYLPEELLWNRPSLDDEYFDKAVTVFGHTPTVFYGEEYKGKIIKTRTWINIDVGASFGWEPVLLRLDDMKEFRNN